MTWALAHKRWAAFLAGALAALGQAPVSFPWASLAGLAFLVWLLTQLHSARGAGWLGWSFGFGYFAVALSWIVEPFLVDPVRHGWMAPFALGGLAAGLALFWAIAARFARLMAGGGGVFVISIAATFALAELARAYVLTGFPWAMIGHVWVGWAPMQLAAWVGAIGLTFVTVLAAAALAVRAWPMLAATAVLYALGVFPAMQAAPGTTGKIVRLVQPNAPQHLKWHPDHAADFFFRMVDFTAHDADAPPDLIVWPETAVPSWLDRADWALGDIGAAADGVQVIFGIQRRDADRNAYNSLAVLGPDGRVSQLYDKHHLVPFGEYIPAARWLARTPLASFVEAHGFGYASGPGARLLDLGDLGKPLPLICYEAIFPQDVLAAPERPDWLLQITNDAWFGEISGPYQHLAQARLRAVEQGLPMVRVANTGVSALIDPRGGIVAQLGLGTSGFVDVELPKPLPPTLYARLGDGPIGIVLGAVALILFAVRRRKSIDGLVGPS